MTIKFPSKSQKKTSLLVDALRVMAWEDYRVSNKDALKDLEYGGYQLFAEEWKKEAVHDFSCTELVEFVQGLEYSINELLNYRSEYYAKKASYSKSDFSSKSDNYADEQTDF